MPPYCFKWMRVWIFVSGNDYGNDNVGPYILPGFSPLVTPIEMLLHKWNSNTHPCPNFYCGLVNTLRPRQNGRHFADDIFNRIFLNENIWIPIKISLTFVPNGSINIIPALVQIMAWRLPGDKPLSEPMMVNLPTHICVTRPQWVKPTFKWIGNHIPLHWIQNNGYN